jgi:hypothetical protein
MQICCLAKNEPGWVQKDVLPQEQAVLCFCRVGQTFLYDLSARRPSRVDGRYSQVLTHLENQDRYQPQYDEMIRPERTFRSSGYLPSRSSTGTCNAQS